MSKVLKWRLAALAFGVLGLALIIWQSNWIVAVGIFFVLWSNNIDQRLQRK